MSEQLVRLHNDPAIPEWLARLERAIVERLPKAEAMAWLEKFRASTSVGVDLESVKHKLTLRRMDRLTALQMKYPERNLAAIQEILAALQQMRRCHDAEISSKNCDLESAWWAAWWATKSEWAAMVTESAWSEKVRGLGAAIAAGNATAVAAWKQEADDLIELLQEAGGN